MHLVALSPASDCCWTLSGGDDFLHLPSHPLLYPLTIISMGFLHLSRILPPLHQCFTWPGMECDANSSLFYDVRIFAVHSYRDIVNTKYLILLRDSRTIWSITNTAKILDPSLLLPFLKGLASSLYNTLYCWQLGSLSCSNLLLLEFPERGMCNTKASHILLKSLQWLLIYHRIRQREFCLCSAGARTRSLPMLSKCTEVQQPRQSILSRWMTWNMGNKIPALPQIFWFIFYVPHLLSHTLITGGGGS